jgi:hypothetical protein
MKEVTLPPLAVYRAIDQWNPRYSDFVVWIGWFRTWYGIVNNFDARTLQVTIIFEGTPRLLFTLVEDEMKDNTLLFDLADIRRSRKGRWCVQQCVDGNVIWYI